MTRKIMEEDDLKTIFKYIVRYANSKPSIAIDRLMNIELVRNTYTKGTIYSMLQRIRRAIRDKRKPKNLPQYIYDIVIEIQNENETTNTQETVTAKPKEISLEEELKEYKIKLILIEQNYNKLIDENKANIEKAQNDYNHYHSLENEIIEAYTKHKHSIEETIKNIKECILINKLTAK